jgi:hypothetical protein
MGRHLRIPQSRERLALALLWNMLKALLTRVLTCLDRPISVRCPMGNHHQATVLTAAI